MGEANHNLSLSPDSPASRGYRSLDRGLKQVLVAGAEEKKKLTLPQLQAALVHFGRFEQIIDRVNKEVGLSIEKAREIIGVENFFGPEEVLNAFGFEAEEGDIPKILFSEFELKRANAFGQKLVLRIDKLPDGQELDGKKLVSLVGEQLRLQKRPRLEMNTDNNDYIFDDNSYCEELPTCRWALVDVDGARESTGKPVENHGYQDLLDKLCEMIERVDGGHAVNEKIDSLIKNLGLPHTLNEFISMDLLRMFCPTFVEALYDFLILYMNQRRSIPYLDGVVTRSKIEVEGGKLIVLKTWLIAEEQGRLVLGVGKTDCRGNDNIKTGALAFQQTEHIYD